MSIIRPYWSNVNELGKSAFSTSFLFGPDLYLKKLSKSVVEHFVFQCSDGERSGGGSAFISGFVLGGLIVGTLGCVYAPQVYDQPVIHGCYPWLNCCSFTQFIRLCIITYLYVFFVTLIFCFMHNALIICMLKAVRLRSWYLTDPFPLHRSAGL